MRILPTLVTFGLLTFWGSINTASAEEADKAASNFVYLKPILLPVLLDGAIDQFIAVTVTLEMEDPAAAAKVHAMEPKLVDAYVEDLYGALDSRKVMRGNLVDPTAIKAALEVTDIRILGTMPCKVLIQNIGQRSLRGAG